MSDLGWWVTASKWVFVFICLLILMVVSQYLMSNLAIKNLFKKKREWVNRIHSDHWEDDSNNDEGEK